MKISDTKNQRYSVFQYVPDIIISWTYACRFSYTCICLLLNFCICVCVCLCICARCGGEGSPPPSYKWYHESSNLSLDLGEREATSSRFGDRLSPYDDEDDIYIMMKCLCVTKNDHFIKRPVCQPWKWRSVVSWFFVVCGWFACFFKVVSWFLVGFHGFSR